MGKIKQRILRKDGEQMKIGGKSREHEQGQDQVSCKVPDETMPAKSYECRLCGRQFTRPIAHKCVMGFLKRINKAARKRGLTTLFTRPEGEE
jgi:hypothetical protein